MTSPSLSYVKEMFAIAEVVASFSKDPSTKVGAVGAVNGRVIGTGRNGFPPKIPDIPALYENRDAKHLMVKHAEENLVSICGDQIRGGDAFVTLVPCNDCAGLLITSGVKRVFTRPPIGDTIWTRKWELSTAMLLCVGIDVFYFHDDHYEQVYKAMSIENAIASILAYEG